VSLAELRAAAGKLGYTLHVRSLTGYGFRRAFLEAWARHEEPDILIVESLASIRGVPASSPTGPSEGIDADPQVAGSLVKVSGSFDSIKRRAWKFLVRTSPRYEVARALALRPIDCVQLTGRAFPSWTDETHGVLTDAATKAVVAHVSNDAATLDQLSGDHYPDDALPIQRRRRSLGVDYDPLPRAVHQAQVCAGFGNQRVAFVDVVVAFEGPDEMGYRDLVAFVGLRGAEPRLLALSEAPDIFPVLLDGVQRMAFSDTPTPLSAPTLTAPTDGATIRRGRTPHLTWRPPSSQQPFYIVEWQEGEPYMEQPRQWLRDRLAVVPPLPAFRAGHPVSFPSPFPCARSERWRVWAISRAGDYSRSEWRMFHCYDGRR